MTLAEERLGLIGEDLVDLLMNIESSFQVTFTQDDLVAAITIGNLFDCVLRKVGPLGPAVCLSNVAFYRLRSCLAEVSASDRKAMLPSSSLCLLMPWSVRKKWWGAIGARLNVSLPPLQAGNRFMIALIFVAVGVVAYVRHFGFKPSITNWFTGIIGGALCAVLVWLLLLIITRPPHREFPGKVQNLGDLVRLVVSRNHQRAAGDAGGSTESQVWSAFRELVSQRTGLLPAAITRDMRFPQDLGIY